MELTKSDYTIIKKSSNKYGKRAEDREDIFQLAVIKCLKAEFKGNCKRGNFLYIITKNTALNYYKAKPVYADITKMQEDSYTMELKDLISFKELPTKQRHCLEKRLLGYSHKEIAKSLGISVSSSKANYRHAVKSLKENLTFEGVTFGTGVLVQNDREVL